VPTGPGNVYIADITKPTRLTHIGHRGLSDLRQRPVLRESAAFVSLRAVAAKQSFIADLAGMGRFGRHVICKILGVLADAPEK
jgi:hypothetical protein